MNEEMKKCYKKGCKAGAHIVDGIGRFCLRYDIDAFEDILAALSWLPRLLYANEYLYVMRKVCRTTEVKSLKILKKFQNHPDEDIRVAFASGIKEVIQKQYMDYLADDGHCLEFLEREQEEEDEG